MAKATRGDEPIQALLREDRKFPPPKDFRKRALVSSEAVYRAAARDPVKFWEQRAKELLKSCVNDEEWEMYRDLGLIRVWGAENLDKELRGVPYAYLIYPHKPIVAYLPQTGRLLNEYCVEFPDESKPYGSSRLPDSDDVLAKWMALKGDERRLITSANMHLPGRQIDPKQIQRDIWRLGRWERERLERTRRTSSGAA